MCSLMACQLADHWSTGNMAKCASEDSSAQLFLATVAPSASLNDGSAPVYVIQGDLPTS